MRAACRNCRFHHAKCNFKPPKAPGRRAPLSSRIPVTLVMRTAAPSNRTSLQRSHPRRSMRFFSAADRPQPTLLGYRRKGGVQRSEAFGLFIDDACHGTAQGSGLNSKMAVSRKLAARRELAATPFGRRFGRPDLMCAAQHPEFERCATNPAPFV